MIQTALLAAAVGFVVGPTVVDVVGESRIKASPFPTVLRAAAHYEYDLLASAGVALAVFLIARSL